MASGGRRPRSAVRFALAAAVAALSLGAGGAGATAPASPTAAGLIEIARAAALRASDPSVRKAWVVRSTHGAYDFLDGYRNSFMVPPDLPTYVIALQGDFVDKGASIGSGASLPRGHWVELALDARTLRLLDWGIGDAPPRLQRLSHVDALRL